MNLHSAARAFTAMASLRRPAALGCVLSILTCLAGCPAGNVATSRVMVPMTDGVRLDTLVVQPAGAGPWPTLLLRTPYPQLQSWLYTDWAERGYAVVAQNTRGRYNSEGSDLAFAGDGWGTPALGNHHDGLDTVNWIRAQTWSNGRIGTYGKSADGITQNLLAGANPPGLCAQWIEKAPINLYESAVFHGGAFRQEQVLGWLRLSAFDPESLLLFTAHPLEDSLWDGFNIEPRQNLRRWPVAVESGWYDTFLQGSLDNYVSIRTNGGPVAREQSKLVITLSAHVANLGEFAWPSAAKEVPAEYTIERFQERYLKGIPNGYDTLPRVAYYQMGDMQHPEGPGNKWCHADDWPVPATETAFYLHSDGALNEELPTTNAAPVAFQYDPENPVPTLGGANLVLPQGNFDQQIIEDRPDVLLFDYGPLTEPLAITGRLWATIYASSDRIDTDITVKLTDVYPDGRSIILCDGIRKGRHHLRLDGADLLTPGTVYPFPVDLSSTAMVFNTGHTIRIAVSSSNSPRYAPNPNTGGPMSPFDPINPQVATNTIYMDAEHPSHVAFPVVPVE